MAKYQSVNDQDNILHAVAVRTRVTGSGNLRISLHSLQDEVNSNLKPIPMQTSTARLIDTLSNFRSQRIQIEMKTIDIDETFTIDKFYIFIKPVATSYPVL